MVDDNKERYEVILQAFNPDVIGDGYLQFPCSYCETPIKVTKKDQEELASGGVGYKCQKCETYYALTRCPHCQKTIGFDDVEWEMLRSPDGYKCPTCDKILFVSQTSGPVLGLSGIVVPNLKEWSVDERERKYTSSIKTFLNRNQLIDLAIYHRTVGDRIESANRSLIAIENLKILAKSTISNVNHCLAQDKPEDNEITAQSADLNNEIFNSINCLRSSLDVMCQELGVIYTPDKSETKIDLRSIVGFLESIGNPPEAIIRHLQAYEKTEDFIYLNDFRNTIQHRRVTIYQETGSFDLGKLNSIKPVSLKSEARIILPNEPKIKFPDATYKKSKELKKTLAILKKSVVEFILETYNKIEKNKKIS
ncbi:MAG: hypothetical protein JRD93_02280 [Deltaproteobacteria bacterium]|nr:hypothetical protein [Deltaproteobacteria bacterium]